MTDQQTIEDDSKQYEMVPTDEDNIYVVDAGDNRHITVVANEAIAAKMESSALGQACCAAHYHGVQDVVLTPDAHQGYGVPIGAVIRNQGLVHPYLVGVDIACGMRCVLTEVEADVLRNKEERDKLIAEIHQQIPVGPDSQPSARLDEEETRALLQGRLTYDEDHKVERSDLITDLRPEIGAVDKARWQLGTLGGGNHFVELQRVTEVDDKLSKAWGLWEGQLVVMIHSGSRRVGFDICNRFHGEILRYCEKQGIQLPNNMATFGITKHAPRQDYLQEDQEKVLRKFGDQYIEEMYMANNFAVANRSWMQAAVQRALKKRKYKKIDLDLLYDISHNIAAIEYDVDTGEPYTITRKGATRAFPKGHPMLKGGAFYETGHPIILPGSMDSASYIMVGTQGAKRTNFSINHGAGRQLGRMEAKRTLNRSEARKRMKNISMLHDAGDLIEETQGAYKDISEITDAVVGAGLARVVAKVEPLGVVKGVKDLKRKKKK